MKIFIGVLGFVFACGVSAQSFPSKPLKFIVPYPPGGGTDILGRALGQIIGESVGQPVIVENRPGANGAVGSDIVAKSAPDGYTVGFAGSSTHVLNPLLYKLNYDPVKDFTPITTVATTSFVVVVKPDASAPYQYGSLRELIAYVKANPGKVSYASFGNASAGHLAGEMFKYMAGVNMEHVPYKGSAPGQADVMAGHVPVMFSDMSGMAHVKSGKLRALAVTGGKRLSFYPEIPTVAESGVPGYDVQGWFAVYGPAGLARPVLDRLNAEFVKALNGAELRARLVGLGLEPATTTPEGLAALMRADREKWVRLIAEAKIKAE
jgi:tripartite-type tricarboxylate transporter receptor subunit TctC